MENIFFIKKANNGEYVLAESNGGPYDLELLSRNYPYHRFIVTNENSSFPYFNIYNRIEIAKACGMDHSLKYKCICGKSNEFSIDKCKKCKVKNKHQKLMKSLFGTDYRKALWDNKFHSYMSEGSGLSYNKSMDQLDEKTQELIKMISDGYKIAFQCTPVKF